MLIEEMTVRNVIITVAIALLIFIAAGIYYYILRRVLHRLAVKTATALDNMLLKSVEWPIFAGIMLLGVYFAIVYLPLEESLDFEIRRGFHLAFIILSAYGIAALLDSLFRWFKLEVTPKTHTALDDWIVTFMRIVTPLLIILVSILLSLKLFNIEAQGFESWLIAHGIRIGVIIFFSIAVLFILGIAGSKAVSVFVARRPPGQTEEEIRKRADTLSGVLITTGQVFIIAIAIFIILSEVGINIAPALAGAGVVGIAVGFGAQSLIKDIIAGFFVVMENQYRVGDVVTIAGVSGLVEEINLRRTVLRDLDGIVHVVPNGEIRVASNFTKEWSRVNLNISVSYGTDLEHAISVINRVCKEMAVEPEWAPLILKTPQVLRVDKLGDSGIELKVLGDTKPIRQWDVMGEIRKRIKRAFDEEGIEIPWPHTKVYFGNSPFSNLNREKEGQEDSDQSKSTQ
jgi:small-conductance mechanosensitive channel